MSSRGSPQPVSNILNKALPTPPVQQGGHPPDAHDEKEEDILPCPEDTGPQGTRQAQ